MAEVKEKGFWSGLFRTGSSAQGSGQLVKSQQRVVSEEDPVSRRQRTEGDENTGSRLRPRRPRPRDSKGKGREEPNEHDYEPTPLSEWPPSGVSREKELSLGYAMELISRGVPAHKGHRRPIPHQSDHYYSLYATTVGNRGDETDSANQHDSMTRLMTMRILEGSAAPTYPWETLEQPSLAFGYGRRPGTVTLNHWVNLSSMIPPIIELRDPGMPKLREVGLVQIFGRLKELEGGLEEDDELRYRNLYRRLLKDPDKLYSPHKTMEKQITDLIMILSRPDWLDFAVPKNHVVTRFIFDTGHTNHQQYVKFLLQLLLSLELDLRINSNIHDDWAKERLMNSIPKQIAWNLALARRWRDNVRVEDYGKTADQVRLRSKLRKRQTKMLKRFAQMMKWPNLNETLEALKQRDAEGTLLDVSSHTMAFFSGLVLPGPTFPFLIMNSLIDVDPGKATNHLALLSHLSPNCGFQYRNSYTYWSSSSVVGKVIAPTCMEVAGWVGPARPTVDLGRSQIARIGSRKPRQRITAEDVASMSERSDPLGPPAEVYPVKEYEVLTPDTDDSVDTIRIELLKLKSLPDRQDSGPKWFEATVQFAIDGVSWPLHLTYDVSFINAWPCSDGPHPLFFDYVYHLAKVDEVVNIRNWGSPSASDQSVRSTPFGGSVPARPASPDDDTEKVLVVEAFGVPDNEVLARAWCSHWGLSAVVADISKTCMACAIREAYAGTVTVVILVEEQ